jgi:hypothetical protein
MAIIPRTAFRTVNTSRISDNAHLTWPGIPRGLTGLFGVKGLLDVGQQVRGTSTRGGNAWILVITTDDSEPVICEDLGRGRSVGRVDGETSLDERLGLCRDALPVLRLTGGLSRDELRLSDTYDLSRTYRLEPVITPDDRLHLLVLGLPVKRCVSAEQKVAARWRLSVD